LRPLGALLDGMAGMRTALQWSPDCDASDDPSTPAVETRPRIVLAPWPSRLVTGDSELNLADRGR
jgi:hypothetical protein